MAGVSGSDFDLREIDEVIERLGEIIDAAMAANGGQGDRMGWFAAMYRRVTIAVRDGIEAGRFENGQRMVTFDKVFAERFIRAWDDTQAGRRPTEAWQVAFDGAKKRRLVIVQQLLLGMNAHINLDLGIAAATTARTVDEPIAELKTDFDRINQVLAELTQGFIDQVGELSPWFGLLEHVGGRTETKVVGWSIDIARDAAWHLALELGDDPPADQAGPIAARDTFTADLGRFVIRPGILIPLALLVVRSREPNDINRVTRFLTEAPRVKNPLG